MYVLDRTRVFWILAAVAVEFCDILRRVAHRGSFLEQISMSRQLNGASRVFRNLPHSIAITACRHYHMGTKHLTWYTQFRYLIIYLKTCSMLGLGSWDVLRSEAHSYF